MQLPDEVQKLLGEALITVKNDQNHQLEQERRLAIFKAFGEWQAEKVWDWDKQTYYLKMSEAAKIYGWLAVLTARKVIPVWQQLGIPNDERDIYYSYDPVQMLEIAEGVLLGQFDADKALGELCNRFYYGITNLERQTTKNIYCSMHASYAALEAVFAGVKGLSSDFTSQALLAFAAVDENEPGIWHDAQIRQTGQDLDNWLQSDQAPEELKEAFASLQALDIKDVMSFSSTPEFGDWMDDHNKRADRFIPIKYNSEKEFEFWEWWLTETIPQAYELAANLKYQTL